MRTLRACVLAVRLFAIVLSASIITARIAAAADPMGFDEARHLLNRTSFAANVEDIQAFAALTRTQAVDQLLAWTATTKVSTPAPACVNEFESPRRLRGLSEEERKLALRAQAEKGAELRSWWLTEMLTTRSPLTEKMVLFWHNHFVSSLQKVRSPVLTWLVAPMPAALTFNVSLDFPNASRTGPSCCSGKENATSTVSRTLSVVSGVWLLTRMKLPTCCAMWPILPATGAVIVA